MMPHRYPSWTAMAAATAAVMLALPAGVACAHGPAASAASAAPVASSMAASAVSSKATAAGAGSPQATPFWAPCRKLLTSDPAFDHGVEAAAGLPGPWIVSKDDPSMIAVFVEADTGRHWGP